MPSLTISHSRGVDITLSVSKRVTFRGIVKSVLKRLFSPVMRVFDRHVRAVISDELNNLFNRLDADLWQKQQAIEGNVQECVDESLRKFYWVIDADLWQKQQAVEDNLYWRIDAKIWKTYKDIERNAAWNRNIYQPKIYETNIDILFNQNKVEYTPGEIIRVAFLFYIPSAWASLESVWEAVNKDERFAPVMLLFERVINEKSSQVLGGKTFLEERGIPHVWADDYVRGSQKPHIFVYISPWERDHLPSYLRSDKIKSQGIHVAYIPYGIEYAETHDISKRFSNNEFSAKPWRMFAISERMIEDHKLQSPQGYDHIRAIGHPKFDGLLYKNKFAFPDELDKRIKGRKIVLMCLHFTNDDYWPHSAVPDITEYIAFLQNAGRHNGLFFLLRPHPRFYFEYEKYGMKAYTDAFREAVSHTENCELYEDSDYRTALYNADYVIGDRSALMVEAAALGVPVLYMTNFFFQEKMLPSVAPLFDSYYQGNSAYDIERFIHMVIYDRLDYKKAERDEATRLCLPYLSGSSAQRILDEFADSLAAEGSVR